MCKKVRTVYRTPCEGSRQNPNMTFVVPCRRIEAELDKLFDSGTTPTSPPPAILQLSRPETCPDFGTDESICVCESCSPGLERAHVVDGDICVARRGELKLELRRNAGVARAGDDTSGAGSGGGGEGTTAAAAAAAGGGGLAMEYMNFARSMFEKQG